MAETIVLRSFPIPEDLPPNARLILAKYYATPVPKSEHQLHGLFTPFFHAAIDLLIIYGNPDLKFDPSLATLTSKLDNMLKSLPDPLPPVYQAIPQMVKPPASY